MRRILIILASVFYVGYFPIAPGTIGTLAGVGLYWLLWNLPLAHYIVFLVVFILLSIWAADQAQLVFNERDSPKIVIDEVAGFLVAMAGHAWGWKTVVICFILFRFFDIVKPFPIRRIETRFHSGIGVVLDDVLAGVYANVCLVVVSLPFVRGG